jgi:outer membrane receptor for ferrienterochelin and colicins
MIRISPPRSVGWLLALLVLLPGPALGQTGRIVGTVADAEGRAVSGAQVSVVGTRLGGIANAQGRFEIAHVPAGVHELRVSHVAFRASGGHRVEVRPGEETLVALSVESATVQLDGIVVSAGRRPQRITEAPASITRIDAQAIDNAVGNTFAGLLKEVKGLDFVQVGATSVGVNARGFNSSFNNRMLMMEDGRIAVLPENGLPVGQFTAVPKIDLAGVEVLVGPGAALYGADASSGVITLQSRDPREFPGTTVEVLGGNRQYKNVQARHAGSFGDFGYKAAVEWQDVNDWENTVSYVNGTLPETGVDGNVNWNARVARGTGALVWYRDNGRLELSTGMSESDGVGQTNVGRNQLDGWRYNFLQAKAAFPGWFFNAYRTQSQSGDSYALNRFTENRAQPANAGKSDEEIRLMSDWPSNGRLYAVEAQNNFRLAPLLGTQVVWGAQYRRDVVSSDRQWLTDRLTGADLSVGQFGVYGQTETPLFPWLNLVLAGRMDDHEHYDRQFSPKAGVVVMPAEHQAVRLTYNRAFKSPTILQTSFYIPNFAPGIAVMGNTQGYEVRNAAGQVLNTFGAVVPEENETWELGYKGVLGNRLFVDVTGWRGRYENFLSPLQLINFPALGTFAYTGGQRVVDEAGNPQATLIYFNLGEARLRGAEAGLNFLVSPRFNVRGTYSWTELQSIEKVDIKNFAGAPDTAKVTELSSLNSPEKKLTLGAGFTDIHNLSGGLTMRRVDEYFFASGINKGTIPEFTAFDVSLSYRLPWTGTRLQVSANNLFTCRGEDLKDPNADSEGCGFGKRHREMINMPEIGTMLFVGMRYTR